MADKKGKIETEIKFEPVDQVARRALDFKAGDTVRVSVRVKDTKGKLRSQAFEGIVLARKHGTETGATFTVRKVASGIGVERIFPLYSPVIEKIEIVKKARAHRAKLYYIRDKAVKDVRRKLRASVVSKEVETEATGESEPEVETEKTEVETETKKEE